MNVQRNPAEAVRTARGRSSTAGRPGSLPGAASGAARAEPKRRTPSVLLLLPAAALAVCAGCRLLDGTAHPGQTSSPSATSRSTPTQAARDDTRRPRRGDWVDRLLEEYLSQDRWQVDERWSVLAELDAAASTRPASRPGRPSGLDVAVRHRLRWRFGQQGSPLPAPPNLHADRRSDTSRPPALTTSRPARTAHWSAWTSTRQPRRSAHSAPPTRRVTAALHTPVPAPSRTVRAQSPSSGSRGRPNPSAGGPDAAERGPSARRSTDAGSPPLVLLRRTADGRWENAQLANERPSSGHGAEAGESTSVADRAAGSRRTRSSRRAEAGGSVGSPASDSAANRSVSENGQGSPAGDLPSQTETADGSPWDGFWPLSPLQWLARKAASSASEKTLPERLARLAGRDDLVGVNAAVLWARESPLVATAVAGKLERVVAGEGGAWSESLRAAAAEAWCCVLAASVRDSSAADHSTPTADDLVAFERALAPAGRLLLRTDLPDPVRAELFRGCARWVAPDRIPRLANALAVGADGERAPLTVRRAALEACVLFAGYRALRVTRSADERPSGGSVATSEAVGAPTSDGGPSRAGSNRLRPPASTVFDDADYPPSVWNARSDPDPQVRVLFGWWLATARPPDACRLLERQLHDTEPRVREAAFESLGRLRTAAALEVLRQQARRSEPRARQLAVRGLAAWGPSELQRLADDPAYAVRQEVARRLAEFPSARAAVLLQQLVGDRSPQVQQAAVDAVGSWPDELAVAVLLQGLLDGSLTVRQRCRERLSERLGTWVELAVEAPRAQRAEAVRRLCRQFGLSASLVESLQKELAEAASDGEVRAERRAEIEQWLETLVSHPWTSEAAQQAWQRLQHVGANELWVVEEFALEHAEAGSSNVLYDKVLPRLSRTWDVLKRLESEDVNQRRRAAQELAVLGEQVSLSPAATRRLHDLLAREQDELVWRLAMQAVLPDDTEQAAQIALLAVNHTWPDIRRLGCRYVQRHPHPQYALWLLPLLSDTNRRVQLEAVRALGRCRNPVALDGLPASRSDAAGGRAVRGLRDLLTSPDRSLRMAVAVSMAELGDEQGAEELIRLSYDKDPNVRIEVIRAMAQTGRTRFVEHLVRLAWTERHAIVKREILAALEQLVPPENRPPSLAQARTDQQRVEAWVEWWQERPAGAPASTAQRSDQ